MSWYTTAFGAHYPLLYHHRDAQEAARCLDLLPRLAPLGSGPVLDLGCGQGRHLSLLAARHIEAIGIDLSAALLAAARSGGCGQPLVRADMRAIPLRESSVTAVLSLFTAFGYFAAPPQHAIVVQEIARVLRPGGHWYLDYLNSRRVRRELAGGPRETVRDAGPLAVVERRRLADTPPRVVKEVILTPLAGQVADAATWGVAAQGLRYAEEVALLDLEELDDLAAGAGLRRVAAAGDYAGGRLDETDSPRWLLVYAAVKETP